MAQVWGIDHRYLVASTFAVAAGAALYSTYKLRKLQRRLATQEEENIYESEKSLQEYLLFHYAAPSEVFLWDAAPKDAFDFPRRCADMCIEYFDAKAGVPNRALDIGCAVGRHTFELTKCFDDVVGIDYSHSFVDACNELKKTGSMSYKMLLEGDLYQDLQAVVNPALDREKSSFQQGDACCLSSTLGQFGCVLAANLICRLHTPKDFLISLSKLVAPGGTLVITSPYTFLREYTPRENWVGAYKKDDGTEFTGFQGLKTILGPHFDFLADDNFPFFIRETRRKNQWTVAHVTVWRRKN
ncbi:hypothetical protein CAPTEDRAFT_169490 [Capitella teleta]|uniref:Methyltransferase type 11 domain-containing protein n=1 Tax=Capitella teleta TaxID=283909 RepID=R7U4K8_CAPTE|nr:hypothetical protein CAPTEDRAFT_169490 [Capitella teleta]|eukprot:ELT98626.1 hypothetical protein CAPTEDRAFT_169490 [Capitella teleta]